MSMEKLYWTTLMWIVSFCILVGFVLPILFSLKSTFAVIYGVVIIIGTSYVIFKRILRIIKGLKNEKTSNN